MPTDWDGGPVTRKFANAHRAVIPGQGRFTKRVLPRGYHLQCERGITEVTACN